jgi:Zn-dependent peptidase ImmA (M78 family)
VPQRPSANTPYAAADDLLKRYGTVSAPVPVEKIAKSLGIQVRFSPLDDELSGMIFIKEGIPIIGVNAIHHPNRQRFTIAHEIGHFELHRDMLSKEVHVDKSFPAALMRDNAAATGTDLIEIQANQFAAALLMPKSILEVALEGKAFDIDNEKPIEELAKKLRVSKQALEYRIRNAF